MQTERHITEMQCERCMREWVVDQGKDIPPQDRLFEVTVKGVSDLFDVQDESIEVCYNCRSDILRAMSAPDVSSRLTPMFADQQAED